MNISTEHILQCNQSEPLADASGRIVDLMNENELDRNWYFSSNNYVWAKFYDFFDRHFEFCWVIVIMPH